jgi:NAD(P)-dependent dehydrogenase (short-subunit alcohol dehydrogenase family)
VTKEADCIAMASAARKAHGPIDIVVANAGAAASAPVEKTDLSRWQSMIDLNLTGAFLTMKAALADVTRGSEGPRRIIFIASTAALKGYPLRCGLLCRQTWRGRPGPGAQPRTSTDRSNRQRRMSGLHRYPTP